MERLRQKYNLTVLIAEGEHQTNVHNALYLEPAKNIFLPETRPEFTAAIADLVARGAQVIILGCTEFGMLAQAEDSAARLIDTSTAHVEAVIDLALED